jgi:AraC family cel operon transcriptional repressor
MFPVLKWNDICSDQQSVHLGRTSAPQAGNWRMHSHDFYECFHIEAGKGWHLLENERHPLEQGMLVFIRPEHAHGFQVPSRKLFTLTNIALPASTVEGFMSRHCRELKDLNPWLVGERPVVVQMNALTQKRFDQLIDDLAWGNRNELDADFFLNALFRLLSGPASHAIMAGLPDWLQTALLHMEQPQNLQAGVARLVELCARTPEHVSRSFKRYLGETPSNSVNGLRVRYARQLLETTDLTITEVAFECGFDNLSYFHRLFKNSVGVTPLVHRSLAGRTLGGVSLS